MSEHKYKLIYINVRGVAELSRLVFKVADVDFVDERIKDGLQGEEWAKRKQEMPLNRIPVLEIDGKMMICQSNAISRYLAREFGLMGSNNLDALRIEELQEMFSEMVIREIVKLYHETDLDKKKEIATAFGEDALQKYLNFVERRLKENSDGKDFFLGDKLSFADLIIYDGVTMLQTFIGKLGVDPLKDRPLLTAHFERVGAVPRIAEWVKTRPESDF